MTARIIEGNQADFSDAMFKAVERMQKSVEDSFKALESRIVALEARLDPGPLTPRPRLRHLQARY